MTPIPIIMPIVHGGGDVSDMPLWVGIILSILLIAALSLDIILIKFTIEAATDKMWDAFIPLLCCSVTSSTLIFTMGMTIIRVIVG